MKNVFTLDQFGPFQQDTVDYDDVCVPATIPIGVESRACFFE